MKNFKINKMFKTVMSLLLVLSMLAGCSLMFAGCAKINTPADKKTELEQNKEFVQELETEQLNNIFSSISDTYDKIFAEGGVDELNTGSKAAITLTISDHILNAAESSLSANLGSEIDLSAFNTLKLEMDMSIVEELSKMQMAVELGGTEIVALNMLMDMSAMVMQMGIPTLNDTYLKLDMGAMMPTEMPDMSQATAMAEKLIAVIDALPDGAVVGELLAKYLVLALDQLDSVSVSNHNLKVGTLSQSCKEIEMRIYEKDVFNIYKAVLTTAKDDAQLKQAYIDTINALAEYTGEEVDAEELYDQMRNEIINILDDNKEFEETDSETYISLLTYVDSDNNILGRKLALPEDLGGTSIAFYTIDQGTTSAFEMNVVPQADGVALTLKGETVTAEGVTNGTYALAVGEVDYVTLTVKDWTENGGTALLVPNMAVIGPMLGIPSFTNELALEIKLNATGDSGKLELNCLQDSELMIGLAIEFGPSEGPDFEVSENTVDAADPNALQGWAAEFAFDRLLDNLRTAGVPTEIVDALDNAIKG